MLKSNRVTFILAIVMAIVLWAYVLGEVDPDRTITLRNIPIKFLHQTELDENGMVITDMDYDTVSITFSAKRSIANKIKDDDFHVTASLAGLSLGDNLVELHVTKPSNIELLSISSEAVNITAEKVVAVEKEIELELVNETKEETEPKIITMSDDKVIVTGAASLVGKVDKVVAKLDVSRIEYEPKTISIQLEPLDESGREVEDVLLDFYNVSVSAVMQSTKTVPLEVPVKGKESGSVNRQYDVPEEITIKGEDSAIQGIKKIICETVDLANVYESQEIPLVPILPDSVDVAYASQGITMSVTLYNAGTKEFVFDENDINVTGNSANKAIKIHDLSVTVTVKGLSTVVNSITLEDFNLTADASDLETGTHTIDLNVKCDLAGIDIIEAEPAQVTIDVE